MIKDVLMDLLEHTHSLGMIDLIKVESTDESTTIHGVATDRSVIVQGKFLEPVDEFTGTFGMPNMGTLKTILNIEEYKDDATISLVTGKNGPESMHFANKAGDFENDYRFMIQTIVDKILKEVKFKGANWNIEIIPKETSIMRLKYQAQANSDETTFQAKTEGDNLVFTFGDHSTNAGNFIFEHDVAGDLKRDWHWPVQNIINILSLAGDKSMRISDDGATEITVNSGMAEYTYLLPAQSK